MLVWRLMGQLREMDVPANAVKNIIDVVLRGIVIYNKIPLGKLITENDENNSHVQWLKGEIYVQVGPFDCYFNSNGKFVGSSVGLI